MRKLDEGDDEYTVIANDERDPFGHSEGHPFCIDPSCPCHEDTEAIGVVNEQYQGGLLTGNEASQRVRGGGIR